MSQNIRIELNHDGIRELLSSAAIGSECKKAAKKIADAAGEGFKVTSARQLGFGGGRIGYGVKTATDEARLAEAKDKALQQAVSQCRL